jgi:hypothetical protein
MEQQCPQKMLNHDEMEPVLLFPEYHSGFGCGFLFAANPFNTKI